MWRRAGWRSSDGPIRDTALGLKAPAPGRPNADGGRLSAASFEEALRLVSADQASGIVTAPISKTTWSAAGYPWRDHTERLAAAVDAPDAQMVLGIPSRELWCSIATRHVALKIAPKKLSASVVAACARALDEATVDSGARTRVWRCAA